MTDIRRTWAYWRRIAVANAAAALIVIAMSGALMNPPPLRRLLAFVAEALVYTTPVSVLLGLGLPGVMPRLAGRGSGVQWAGRAGAIVALTTVGIVISIAILVTAGSIARSELWTHLVGTLRVAIVIALGIATAAMVLESMRARLEETELALRTKELEEERARKLATEAQLAALESRVHPHFLFNTLNTIAALIHENPAKAEKTVGQLAALLRFSLDAAVARSTPLTDEMRIVRDYLEIEAARFGDRLRFEIDVDPAAADTSVPPLAVQTLVENAVKHGMSTRRDGGWIRVRARQNGAGIVIDVADNGEEFSSRDFPPGHGLDNVRGRLHAILGPDATVSLARDGDWTVARICVPGQG